MICCYCDLHLLLAMLVVNWVVATCWRTEIQLIILASFLVIQLGLLLYKNVGLLTFWILFDYA